jgi:hypothetical protein
VGPPWCRTCTRRAHFGWEQLDLLAVCPVVMNGRWKEACLPPAHHVYQLSCKPQPERNTYPASHGVARTGALVAVPGIMATAAMRWPCPPANPNPMLMRSTLSVISSYPLATPHILFE